MNGSYRPSIFSSSTHYEQPFSCPLALAMFIYYASVPTGTEVK